MIIRNTVSNDIPALLELYAAARERMRLSGNPTQWGSSHPAVDILLCDVRDKTGFVLEDSGRILGTFAFIIGEDPTYINIEGGQWLNSAPYGTIHRIAAAEGAHGIFAASLRYCLSLIPNIKIDTHRDNFIMQHILEKEGFVKCGTIYVADGSDRIAYQKTL